MALLVIPSFSDIRVGSILLFTAARNEMCDVGYSRAARARVGAVIKVAGATTEEDEGSGRAVTWVVL